MANNQKESDKLWSFYQNNAHGSFDSSYSRLEYLSKRCQPGEMVLNVGAGSGHLESLLIRRGVIAHTLDPSELTITRMNEEQGMGERAKKGYCDAIPFPDECFDSVVMTEVLEHIQEEHLDVSLREVQRVLKNGGLFIGTVPYREDLLNNEVFCPVCETQFHRWGHLHSFDLTTLRNLFESSGLQVEQLQTRAFPDFKRPGIRPFLRAIFRYLLGRMGESLVAPNIYFVCKSVKSTASHD